jgi:two-component system, NarL family, nitrate/nitrite response regulator NarL
LGVVIVARVRVYRDGLAAGLERFPSIRVLGTAGSWSEAAGHVRGQHPDILLVEAALAVEGRAARLFSQTAPHVRLVAFAAPQDDRTVLSCVEAGVSGYVASHASISELVEAITRAASGELLCTPRVAATLGRRLSDIAAEHEPARNVSRLTTREVEIVHLIAQNMSNQEIAEHLYIEIATVKNHVHNILAKLEIRGRAEVADWVRGAGVPQRS